MRSIRCQLGATRAAISGGYTRISPAAVPSAASLTHAGYANLTGNCWVASEDGCPAGRMVAVARVNEGEGGAELRLRALSRFEATGVQMLNARNSMAAIPNTSTASATGSYSSQIRMINPTLPIARLHCRTVERCGHGVGRVNEARISARVILKKPLGS